MADDADRDMRRLSLSPLAAPRDDSQPYFTPPAAENGPERNSDLQDLKTAYINEKVAPEMLEYQEDLVTRVEQQIKHQEALLQQQGEQGPVAELVRLVRGQSLGRARYLLRAYLRARLLKLERLVMSVLDDADALARLSDAERQYAQDFFFQEGRGLREAVMQHLPPNFSSLLRQSSSSAERDIMPAPALDAHVFVQVLADCGEVELDPDLSDTVDLKKGDLLITRYRGIRNLLHEKWLQLL